MGGIMFRNTYDFDCEETTLFWYVIKDTFGGLEELSSKMRNQVKKSLKIYDIERISPIEFQRIGLSIYNSAQENYRVKASLTSQIEIDQMAERAKCSNGNVDIWAVYTKDGRIPVAIAYNTLQKDCCNYNTMKCDPAYLHNSTYPYYGLIFEMNRYYLKGLGLKYVNDGARSITEHSNIQSFLIDKFHFRKAYCKLQIHYKWWVRIAVNLLYPFRNIIYEQHIQAIMRMEQIRREMKYEL